MTPRRLFLNHFLLIGKDLTLPEVKWYVSKTTETLTQPHSRPPCVCVCVCAGICQKAS